MVCRLVRSGDASRSLRIGSRHLVSFAFHLLVQGCHGGAAPACGDHPSYANVCPSYSASGYCSSSPAFMEAYCSASCSLCPSPPPPLPSPPPPAPSPPPPQPTCGGSCAKCSCSTSSALIAALEDTSVSYIALAPGNYPLATALVIARDVTLVALVGGTVILDGQGITQVVAITSGLVQMSGLHITGGSSSYGGGIGISGGAITQVRSCSIFSNNAHVRCGGAYITGSSTEVTFFDCSIYENTVVSQWWGTGDGGGVEIVDCKVQLFSCNISRNSANNGGGAYISGSSADVTFSGCSIYSNTAGVSGAGIGITNGNVQFTLCRIHSNTAAQQGGGIYISYSATVAITLCSIFGNTVTQSGGDGDAIYNLATGTAIANTTFDRNGDTTIFNVATIVWTCQLGYYQRQEGHFLGDFDTCSRFACPIGMYGSSSDHTDLRCSGLCTSGHYCGQPATVAPTPCPAGTAFPNVGASKLSQCNACFPGQYQSQPGEGECSVCSAGQYSVAYGSTACTGCPSGACL